VRAIYAMNRVIGMGPK